MVSQQPSRNNSFLSTTTTLVPFALLILNLFHYVYYDEALIPRLLITNVLNAIWLESYEHSGNTTAALEKRRNVDICQFIATTAACTVIADNGIRLVKAIARPKISLTKRILISLLAAGGDCDTIAEEKTIAGALEDHLKQYGDPLCETRCLNLTHGGTWNGYLLIGPADDFDSSAYCGPKLDFDHCTSGGKYDWDGYMVERWDLGSDYFEWTVQHVDPQSTCLNSVDRISIIIAHGSNIYPESNWYLSPPTLIH
ncbi:unnamed protein product [Fusarium equiseti]|uniref:Secreted protein CSS2 C-terminal domain-containing protein n=1 Tax=Fusarium equiseti TaxID=61235 RepID=A0A8J2IQX4_FUSEQ|nr:unnamed protein product [Fusarium equiseti]